MIKKIYFWGKGLSSQTKASFRIAALLLGAISTVITIMGVSLNTLTSSILVRIIVFSIVYVLLLVCTYLIIGKLFQDSISFSVRKTQITLKCGDIFNEKALRVIGCDTSFSTQIDDIRISRSSLHGKLVSHHGDKNEIDDLVSQEAQRLGLERGQNGLYSFPLGSIIKYESSVDGQTYLLLAMTKLDSQNKARTSMVDYEMMLMKMWQEIDRIYAGNNIALPLLGSGITRIEDGNTDDTNLLKCMLCTLKASAVTLNTNVDIVIYKEPKDIPFFEFRNMFQTTVER